MAENSLYPGYVKLFYSVGTRAHTMTLPVNFQSTPPTIGVEPDVVPRIGSPVNIGSRVSSFVTTLAAMYHTSASFTGYEVVHVPLTGDPNYVFGADLSVAGTNTTTPFTNSQAVFSYRTDAGGLFKMYLMESSLTAVNTRLALRSTMGGLNGTLATFMLASTNTWVGRDNGYPISGIYVTTKVNDALRRKTLLEA